MKVLIHVPLHCSSSAFLLDHLSTSTSTSSNNRHPAPTPPTTSSTSTTSATTTTSQSYDQSHDKQHEQHEPSSLVLMCQCHGEGGIIWRGIIPMLSHATQQGLSHFTTILLTRFHRHLQCSSSSSSLLIMSRDAFHTYSTHLCSIHNHNHDDDAILHLFLLPPYPTPYAHPYSTYHHLRPERIYTPYLIHHQNKFLKLQTLNAYLSTMGGGYFLCRHLSISIQIARQQCAVALAMGDVNLALKCLVNEAYNWIHVGQVARAGRVLHCVEDMVQLRVRRGCTGTPATMTTMTTTTKKMKKKKKPFFQEDDAELRVIWNMCQSAKLFGKRVERECKFITDVIPQTHHHDHHHHHRIKVIRSHEEEQQRLSLSHHKANKPSYNNNNNNNSVSSSSSSSSSRSSEEGIFTTTHDDYQRIRIVSVTSSTLESMK